MHAFFKYMNAGGAPRRPQTELPVNRNSLSFQMPAHLAQKTAELSPFGKHAEQRPPEQIALGAAFFRPVPFAVKSRAAEYAPKIFGIPFRRVVFPAGAGRHLLAARGKINYCTTLADFDAVFDELLAIAHAKHPDA